jgi:hypothetical protein
MIIFVENLDTAKRLKFFIHSHRSVTDEKVYTDNEVKIFNGDEQDPAQAEEDLDELKDPDVKIVITTPSSSAGINFFPQAYVVIACEVSGIT